VTQKEIAKLQGMSNKSIVVDLREFRCSLPSMLHSSHYDIVPRTIYVGDYVLSSEICVERKGISDLFQSFASGRLYNQAESMGKYYKYPCLLIEFAPDKAFSLSVSWFVH
jgi:DNA excision repair protein ERCC-4